jgi:hypothetical protein
MITRKSQNVILHAVSLCLEIVTQIFGHVWPNMHKKLHCIHQSKIPGDAPCEHFTGTDSLRRKLMEF